MRSEMTMSGRKVIRSPEFDVDKAIASVAYLVEQTGETLYPVMKMLYLADKMHLQKYGRFIAGDSYSAMEKGPVPSCTYNMLKHVKGDRSKDERFDRASEFLAYSANHRIELKQAPDYDELSSSEIGCLQAIVNTYYAVGKWAVRDLSHDQAWSSAWSGVSKLFKRSIAMDIEDIAQEFENADVLISHLRDSNPGEAQLPTAIQSKKATAA